MRKLIILLPPFMVYISFPFTKKPDQIITPYNV